MASVHEHLTWPDVGVAPLFTPPFDRTPLDPGYIKGYPPGMRENGGQYTHGALWSVIAFAMLGDGDKASELFSLLNPIKHGSTRTDIERYKVEPYIMSADVYSEPSHVGRGGWTWYTGSAGWMYRTVARIRDRVSASFCPLRNQGRKSEWGQSRRITHGAGRSVASCWRSNCSA